ncbi:alginate export family protein [Shewanella nanhaiensis]|uniref:Alginate export family protein n=1 Tax=Shewanella nanhaiensis TaxID=2864872 RepID=A0ABS7E3Q9_9GAMM|nr:alginate export family protein [Shewanella nanhaiensis]MBW8184331.1 alginate export family protein [Shewanella nanhaiensis]
MNIKINKCAILSLLGISFYSYSEDKHPNVQYDFNLFRAEESYNKFINSDLDDLSFWERMKYIPLNSEGDMYVTLGGEVRPRGEFYINRFSKESNDVNFYSHRIALHTNIQIGTSFRGFMEFYHGYTSHDTEFAEYDELDWHQGFIEYKASGEIVDDWYIRAGRQEMSLGSARLVGFREGPNIRRSFDMLRMHMKSADFRLQAFYGREVIPEFGVFDNKSNIFDKEENNPKLWGAVSEFVVPGDFGKNELYYLGFHVNHARFNDVTGEEKRHSLGLRRAGSLSEAFSYNTEFTYQFGDIGDSKIQAFNFETDWNYTFHHSIWKPNLGLKLEWSSGDDKQGDGEINTFNPMFVNPAYYSVIKIITPANMASLHPSLTVYPTENLKLYLEWAWFQRVSEEDGLYRVTRFLSREPGEGNSKYIGQQLGFKLTYKFNSFWSFDFDISYFKAGRFLEQTGDAEDIVYISPTLRFRF